jgi:hypothetical protein
MSAVAVPTPYVWAASPAVAPGRLGRQGVQIERNDTAEVRMHIRQYTQALLGEPSFADLVQHGLVSSISARAVQDAAVFFSPWPTYIIEFFSKMPIGMGQISSAPER